MSEVTRRRRRRRVPPDPRSLPSTIDPSIGSGSGIGHRRHGRSGDDHDHHHRRRLHPTRRPVRRRPPSGSPRSISGSNPRSRSSVRPSTPSEAIADVTGAATDRVHPDPAADPPDRPVALRPRAGDACARSPSGHRPRSDRRSRCDSTSGRPTRCSPRCSESRARRRTDGSPACRPPAMGGRRSQPETAWITPFGDAVGVRLDLPIRDAPPGPPPHPAARRLLADHRPSA